jgi:hypothetical protein
VLVKICADHTSDLLT